MFDRLAATIFVSVLLWASCGSMRSEELVAADKNPPHNTIVADTSADTLRKTDEWAYKIHSVIGKRAIEKLRFVDVSNGIALTEDQLLRTSDGGKSWYPLKKAWGPDSVLNDVQVVTQNELYVITLPPRKGEKPKSVSEIYRSNDGGTSWTKLMYFDSGTLNQLTVLPNKVLIAVGRKDVSLPESDTQIVALRSEDNGMTWSDVASEMNASITRPKVADFLTTIELSKQHGLLALTAKGRVFTSDNQGKAWRLRGDRPTHPSEFGPTSYHRVGELADGSIWISGGAASVEGNWGVLATTRDLKTRQPITIDGRAFEDVEFISNSEVIAGTSIPTIFKSKGSRGKILYSHDRGSNWKEIPIQYHEMNFLTISKVSDSTIAVGTSDGHVVILKRRFQGQ